MYAIPPRCLAMAILQRNATISLKRSMASRNACSQRQVHYAGVACDMDEIMALANEKGLIIVEDAAQAIVAQRTVLAVAGGVALGFTSEEGFFLCHTFQIFSAKVVIKCETTKQFSRKNLEKLANYS